MKTKFLELKGFVCVHDSGDVSLEETPKDKYHSPSGESIGSLVSDHFASLAKPFEVSFADWTTGPLVHYKDVFVQYHIANAPVTWEEATELSIKSIAGDMTATQRYEGYSEYTITESWVDIFVGGHDLRSEFKTHRGKFAIVRVNYKINDEV